MSNYRKSFYALNKVSEGIVYRNADGSIVEITFEKIAAEDPTFTKEDFENIKKFSDELYHEEEKGDNLEAHYVKSIFDENKAADKVCVESFETALIEHEEKNMVTKKLQEAIDTQLTETQKRRLYMSFFRNMTAMEIAKLEGVSFSKVCKSIRLAKKKIKKYLIIF